MRLLHSNKLLHVSCHVKVQPRFNRIMKGEEEEGRRREGMEEGRKGWWEKGEEKTRTHTHAIICLGTAWLTCRDHT